MASNVATSLYKANKGHAFAVVYVPPVGLLESLGIRAGARVEVEERYALGGPVLLRVEGACSVAIGKDVATQIVVRDAAGAAAV